MRRALGYLLLLSGVLIGCSPPLPTAPAAVPATAPSVAVAGLDPAAVQIPAIGARSTLIATGRSADGGWEVPALDEAGQASWYRPGPEPGEPGPAVILGHVNGGGRPGVFARLHELAVGDEVLVTLADGSALTFRVTRLQQVDKATFPAAEILAPTDRPELRLITCGGVLQRSADGGRYSDNLIAWAVLA